MTEPRDKSDEGPDFSFLGNDPVNDGPGELDFSARPQADLASNEVDPTVPTTVPPTTSCEEISDQPASQMHESVEVPAEPTDAELTAKQSAGSAVDAVETTDSVTSPSELNVANEGDSAATGAVDSVAAEVDSIGAADDEVVAVPETPCTASATATAAEGGRPAPDGGAVIDDAVAGHARQPPMVSQKTFSIVAGYAGALTLLFLLLLITGRISLSGVHQLESLPDIAPLQKNEFQQIPADASLPRDHSLKLGDSRRFGDVIITPLRVTAEPITFAHMTSGKIDSDRRTSPVLKLWFELENACDDVAFPPWDVGLMCSRSPPEGTDESTNANSWLMVRHTAGAAETRLLNYFHPPQSEYDIVGQYSRQLVQPGQSITTFIASSPDFSSVPTDTIAGYRWRLQLRKGVNRKSENGVTTLVEVEFTPDDVSTSG